jgi:hypothetical protein
MKRAGGGRNWDNGSVSGQLVSNRQNIPEPRALTHFLLVGIIHQAVRQQFCTEFASFFFVKIIH